MCLTCIRDDQSTKDKITRAGCRAGALPTERVAQLGLCQYPFL